MHPILTIEMNNGNLIKIELYPEKAPNSINALLWMVFKMVMIKCKFNELHQDLFYNHGMMKEE